MLLLFIVIGLVMIFTLGSQARRMNNTILGAMARMREGYRSRPDSEPSTRSPSPSDARSQLHDRLHEPMHQPMHDPLHTHQVAAHHLNTHGEHLVRHHGMDPQTAALHGGGKSSDGSDGSI